MAMIYLCVVLARSITYIQNLQLKLCFREWRPIFK